ncbi:LacI family transcriptional regulator [Bacillaceae bacterium SIJ1]|uniref:LacI family DNA-binding transcriptional regulator n=1 Tax=Litoribacterium kuwaitense TaxID=1398745 RepID=UPI0013ECE01F|nr:LacI family DNA-binding transcriptional regulator [Litoribacterium kuwaitense]NGP45753.1 LacI family transcriptional regulator [Litoribacterium kuwaitense]
MKKVTMNDVAKDAGVSIATVSKVINNKGYVGQQTFENVVMSIQRLGYRVNANARSLKSAMSNKVAVLISDISNFYLMSLAKQIEKTIRTLGMHMILLSHNDDEAQEYAALQIILEQQVAAVVIIPTGGNNETIDYIKNLRIPVIAIDREVEGVETDLIVDDNHFGSYESMFYLHQLGHHRIGVIYGHFKNSIARDRYQGAVDAIKDFQLDSEDSLIKKADFSEESAFQQTTELLQSGEMPTAIYSCNNTMTKGVIKAIWEQRLKIGEDISVIAFGERSQWELFRPQLTLMTQPVNQIGVEASILLRDRLTSSMDFPLKTIVIKPILDEGKSCWRLH